MGMIFHIAEVAALLLVAYSVGWAIGLVAHRLASRTPARPVVPAERLEQAVGEALPTVAATPLLVANVTPTVNEDEAVVALESAEPAAVASALELAPVTNGATRQFEVASVATPPVVEIVPDVPAAAERQPTPAEASAIIAPAGTATPAPVVMTPAPDESDEVVIIGRRAVPAASAASPSVGSLDLRPASARAAPASVAGVAWSGDINGHAAPAHTDLLGGQSAPAPRPSHGTETFAAPVAAKPQGSIDIAGEQQSPRVSAPDVIVAGREPAPAVVDSEAMFRALLPDQSPAAPTTSPDAIVVPPAATLRAPPPEATAPPEPTAPPEATAVPRPLEPMPPEVVAPDETDAMRAIEGGWSRGRAPAMTGEPELIEVAAAVAAAQTAVQDAIAKAAGDAAPDLVANRNFGKPQGLARPRDNRRDNLKEISGLSALDESTLNNLGIYHLDQIAAWTPQEVFWLENHVFARGRVGRESWQAQARELAQRHPAPSR